jgi:hypothetical protein
MELFPASLFYLINFTFWMAFGDRVMLASPVRGLWFDVGFHWPDGCNRLGVALEAILHGWLPVMRTL